MKKTTKKIYKKVKEMELNNPVVHVLIGLVIFYVGLKMFAGGMKSMGDIEQMKVFIDNPYYMFIGGIIMTLLWQSSSLSTTAIIALVSSGALPLPSALAAVLGANIGTTGTIWIAGLLVSDGIPTGVTRQIAVAHTGFNMLMGLSVLPFVYPIARFLGRF
jgi:Na+/phosphate symporter